ncbi:hypothetical protein [Novosphingobium sp. 11B]
MFKSHVVEQMFDRSALRICAAGPELPIAMGMGLRISHDDLSKRMPPCLRGTPPFPDKASYKQVFKIGCRHTDRLAAVGG